MNQPPEGHALQPGAVVQIEDGAHPWYACLLIVTEVKAWGVQACCLIPQSNDGQQAVAQAYNRLPWAQIEYVGEAGLMPGEDTP